MIDLHTHLLPGLDDGPTTLEESVELAEAFVAEGVEIVACTPHVREDHGTTAAAMEQALALVRAELKARQIPLDVRGGGELSVENAMALDAATLARFGLGGNPRLLLIEFPYYGWPLALPSLVADLAAAGIVPLFAHPERNSEVRDQPERLRPLVEAGAYTQITAGSLDASAGAAVSRCAKTLLETGLAHILASDWHGRNIRRAGLGAGARAAGSDELGRWLTETVPRALLAGTRPPPRPFQPRRRWGRR